VTLRPAGPRGLGGKQILGKAIRNVHSWDFPDVDVLANDRFAPEAVILRPSQVRSSPNNRHGRAPARRLLWADCVEEVGE
jgi:hypothetical protein